jgi:dTDP-4-dehydrorhamnose 3,5-epimerase-like enzyme
MTNNEDLQATVEAPGIRISCLSNVYVRQMHFEKAGIVELGHRHPYDHATLLAAGSLKVQLYDDDTQTLLDAVEYKAPAMILIKKNFAHKITSVEDNTIAYCVHALRDETETIVAPEMFPVPTSMYDMQYQAFMNGVQLIPPHQQFDELTPLRIPRAFNAADKF